MSQRKTSFDPSIHGFLFKNSFDIDPILEWIENYFPEVAESEAKSFVPKLKLCGGMCFAALDRYFTGRQIPLDSSPPAFDSPLFAELAGRQIDSFQPLAGGIFLTIHTCLDWQFRPDEGAWWKPKHSVGFLTQSQEWPKIQSKLHAGIPATMCLVKGKYFDYPSDNHQVVATGYSFDTNTNRLTISIYDPNAGGISGKNISIALGQKNSRLDADPDDVRGFFFIPYDRTEKIISEEEARAIVEDDISWFWLLWGGS